MRRFFQVTRAIWCWFVIAVLLAFQGDARALPIGTTAESVRRILHDIAGDDLVSFFGFAPRVRVVESERANAWLVRGSEIVMTTGLLQRLSSRDQLAFVVLHEIGHARSPRSESHRAGFLGEDGPLAEEITADAWAIEIMRAQRMNPDAASAVLRELRTDLLQGGAAEEAFERRILAITR